MKTMSHTTKAERAGRRLGSAWRGYMRKEVRAVQWLASNGLPASAGRLLFWVVMISVFCVLLYITFWLTLLLLLATAVALAVRNTNHDEPQEWAIGDQSEHKKSVFYDPILYNDDPDPRFDDEK